MREKRRFKTRPAFYTSFPFPGSIAHKFRGGTTCNTFSTALPLLSCRIDADPTLLRHDDQRQFSIRFRTAYGTRAHNFSSLSALFPFSPSDAGETIRSSFCIARSLGRRGSFMFAQCKTKLAQGRRALTDSWMEEFYGTKERS